MTREQLVETVASHLHADQHVDGARLLAEFSGKSPQSVDTHEVALEYCNSLLYWCLNTGHYPWAARLLWTENLFTHKPRCTQMVWREIEQSNSVMLMGAASMSKSYGAGVWLFLDWIRDPEYTNVNLVGPSENHLKDNLFTHLATLHSQSSLPMPGVVGDLFIGLDPRQRKSAIIGVVIPLGKRPAGRLQGRKRVPRKTPHPSLGKLSRIRFMLDEFEKIPVGVFKDIDNIFANLDTDVDGFKIITAFNPEDPHGQVAVRCEPDKGWEAFDRENDEVWTSKRGWKVLRLDAAKCENVVEKKVIYPGLQTWEGYQRIIQSAGGAEAPGALTMGRACFPTGGATFSVIPSTLIARMKAEVLFAEPPEDYAGVDLSLEGGDPAEFCKGRFGRAGGIKLPPTFENEKGKTVYFTDKHGNRVLRWVACVDQIFTLDRGDTVKMAEQVRSNGVRLNVAPRRMLLDRTGNGAGVHDLLKSLWSEEVRGLNYSEAATEKKILVEDTKTPLEEYERAVSELWFAIKKWGEFQFFFVAPSAMSEELVRELGGRRYAPGKITRVESKPDYKSRGNPSPNKADAVTLFLHCIRVNSGVVPSAADGSLGSAMTGEPMFDPIVIVDDSNKFEDLDMPEQSHNFPFSFDLND